MSERFRIERVCMMATHLRADTAANGVWCRHWASEHHSNAGVRRCGNTVLYVPVPCLRLSPNLLLPPPSPPQTFCFFSVSFFLLSPSWHDGCTHAAAERKEERRAHMSNAATGPWVSILKPAPKMAFPPAVAAAAFFRGTESASACDNHWPALASQMSTRAELADFPEASLRVGNHGDVRARS